MPRTYIKTIISILALALVQLIVSAQDFESLISSCRYSDAVRSIDNSLVDADSTQARTLLIRKASCQKMLGDYLGAAESLRQSMEMNHSGRLEFGLMAELGDCYAASGLEGAALEQYLFLAVAQPDNLFFKLKSASLYYKLKDYSSAASLAEGVFAADSNSTTAISIIAGCEMAFKNYGRAEEMYKRLLRLRPDNTAAGSILGTVQYVAGEYKESQETFQGLLDMGMETYGVFYYLGMNQFMQKNFSAAAGNFERAYQIDSSDVNLMYYLGNSLVKYSELTGRKDNIERARRLLDSAYNGLQPDLSVIYKIQVSKAISFFTCEDWQHSLDEYMNALQTYRQIPDAKQAVGAPPYYYIAYCNDLLRNDKAAIDWYMKYLDTLPENATSRERIEQRIQWIREDIFMKGE